MSAQTTNRKRTAADDGNQTGEPIHMWSGPAAGWSFMMMNPRAVPTADASPSWMMIEGTDADGTAGLWLFGETANRPAWAVWRIPYVVEHVIRRDGDGRESTRLYLVAADQDPDSPRELVSTKDLSTGNYGGAMGLTPPAGHKLCELIATAVIVQPCDVRTEAIPQIGRDGYYTALCPDVLPHGYGQESAAGDAECVAAWSALAPAIAANPRLALVLGMSAVAPYVSPLNRQPRMVNLTGEARQGKTTGLDLSAAWWGYPGHHGHTAVVRSWNASALGIPQYLGRLGIMPAYLNEAGASTLDTTKRMALVYSIVEGNTRQTGTADGLGRATAGWASVVFSTSNATMLGTAISAGAGAGIPARLLELQTPFTRTHDDAERLSALARSAYGHPGRLTLARFTVTDVENLIGWAAERLPIPADATVSRTIMQHWHDAVAGAVMVDTVLGTGTLIQDAAIAAVRAIDLIEPPHDAEMVLAEIRDRMAATPAEWPTQALYAEWHQPRPDSGAFTGPRDQGRPALLQHGIMQTIAGIVADDGSWIGVLPGAWKGIHDTLGTDSGVVCEWLDRKGLIHVARSARASREWQTPVSTKVGKRRVYKITLPEDPEPEEDTPEQGSEPAPAPVAAEPVQPELTADGQITPESLDRWYAAIVADLTEAASVHQLETIGADIRTDSEVLPFTADQLDTLRTLYADRMAQLRPAPVAIVPAPRPAPVPALPQPRPAPQSAPAGPPRAAAARPNSTRKTAPAAPVRAGATCYVAAGQIVTAGGQRPAPGSLLELLTEASAGPGSHVTVLIGDPVAFGFAAKRPAALSSTRWHKAFKPATDAGWHGEGTALRRPTVGAWTNLEHPEHGTVRVCLLTWLGNDYPFPYSTSQPGGKGSPVVMEDPDGVTGAELVRRVDRLADVLRESYRGTPANTGVRMLREMIGASAQRVPAWQGTADIASNMAPLAEEWVTADTSAALGENEFVHPFDSRRNYLQPIREVRLPLDNLRPTGPLTFDQVQSGSLAGMFLIEIPEWPYPMLPAPTSQTGKGWVTWQVLKTYAQYGVEPVILQSLSGKGTQLKATRDFVAIVDAAYLATAGDQDQAVQQVVKGTYQSLHGKLRSQYSAIRRGDWGFAMRDEAWSATLRHVYRIAGISEFGQPITGPTPLKMHVDEMVYGSPDADVTAAAARLGLTIGTKIGQFKSEGSMTADQWRTQGSE